MKRARERADVVGRAPRGTIVALAFALALGGYAQHGSAQETPASIAVPRSSLLSFVDEVAATVEARAKTEGVSGPVRLDVDGARGIDARKAEREFGARLRRRLRDGATVVPVSRAPVRVRIVLSQEGGRVWAVGTMEGGRLPGPLAFAVSAPIDRELEVALGAGARPGQSRWLKERLGTVPAGVLDLVLVDVNDDVADDIAVLSVDGIRLYRYAPGDSRPELLSGPHALPGERAWPRVLSGWMSATKEGELWFATSAGHSALFDPKKRAFKAAPQQGVPLRQPTSSRKPQEPLLLLSARRFEAPLLALPAASMDGKAVQTAGLPPTVRDLVHIPASEGTWLWIDQDGFLGGRLPARPPQMFNPPLRLGDRFLFVDLDTDGQGDLVTTAPTMPGEADEITIFGVDPSLEGLRVIFRTPLSGGAAVALATGELDYDGYPDVLVVEEGAGAEAVLWRLELAP
jgi:hypothetical protein